MKLREYLSEATIKGSFFISPRGEIVSTEISHIGTIVKYPEKFGLTNEYIKDVYKKHDEPIGFEGNAREEIIRKLMDKGWIRIRRYPNKYWSIQIPSISRKVKDYMYDWSKRILKGIHGVRERDRYMPVKITSLKGRFDKTYTVDDLSKDVLYNESVNHTRETLVECSIEDLEVEDFGRQY